MTDPAAYDVTWTSPSADARGSMPLGNGDVTINAWVEPDGDLRFYVGKSDAWDEQARLLKLGRLRVALTPNPFRSGASFTQRLHLHDGEIRIAAGDVQVVLRVDAHHPVVVVEVTASTPVAATVTLEPWRQAPEVLPGLECSDIFQRHPRPPSTVVTPDQLLDLPGTIGWYHHNAVSIGPDLTMRHQDLLGAPWSDPLLHRTMGAVVRLDGAERRDRRTLAAAPGTAHVVEVHVLTRQPSNPSAWLDEVTRQAEAVATLDRAARRAAHLAWWHAFWARSWIHVHDRAPTPPLATRAPLRLGDGPCGSSRWQGTLHEVRLARGAVPVATWPAPVIGLHPDVDASPGEDLTITLRVRTPPRDDGGFLCCWTTPDRADGLLIDTEPCIPVPPAVVLRITRGDRRWITPQVLRPDTDHVIVVTIVGGVASLILDGVPVPLREPDPATPGHDVAQGYTLQRFLTACAGRGAFPIKFNGSLFTVGWDGRPGDADYRRWGPGYWWQNSRLPYLAACTAGDDELLEPFFRMYDDVLAVSRHRTQRYFGIDGAYLPECVYTWGAVFMESYGWAETAAQREDKLQVSGYHKREWVAGLELAWMQLERFDHTGNTAEFHRRILPTALAVLRFFDGYYRPGPDGRLVMHPAQALEMWWDVTNPAPEIAGLQAVTERLLALPDALVPPADRAWLAAFRQRIPDLPVAEVDGHRLLTAAGAIHSPKRNVEHPELYAVFPFRRITTGHPDAPLAVEALRRRLDRGCYGWRQDDLFMAGLGLAREARDGLVSRARQRSPCRFPAFWGPNFDWTPDQDHGGVLMRTLQQMLLQTDGRRIRLLPAWPQEWDVDFRLHAPFGTVITGRVEGGKLASWTITPSERAADVEVGVPS